MGAIVAFFALLFWILRLSNVALPQKQLLINTSGTTKNTVAYWQFETAPGMLQDSTANRFTLVRHSSASAAKTVVPIDAPALLPGRR